VARGRSIRVARYALAAAFMAVGLLLILAAQQSPARAATSDPTGSTCPDGYHWERMSGVGCVQNNLPPNARYSYTSAAICNDGFIAVHEPGPNSFGADPNASYLTACLTQAEWDARNAATPSPAAQADGGGGEAAGPLDQVAQGLAEEGTTQPDEQSSSVAGLAATGMLLLSAGGAMAASGGSGVGQAMGGHGGVPDVLRGGASSVGQGMAGGAGSAADAMRGGAAAVGQAMGGGPGFGVGQGVTHASAVGQGMGGGASAAGQGVGGGQLAAGQGMGHAFGAGQAMSGGAGSVGDAMRGGATAAGQGMTGGAAAAGQGIAHASGVGQGLTSGATAAGQGMTGGATAAGQGIAGGAGSAADAMRGGATAVGQGIAEGAGSAGVLAGPSALDHAVSGGASTAGAFAAAGLPGITSGAGTAIASGFSLSLPRFEMVQAGLSIFRSMKRVTEEPNPSGYSQSELTLLLGDMAGIAAVASALTPAVGLITLTAAGAATAHDVRDPRAVFETLRRNFGRLGYLQGVVDENVTRVDGELGGLDVSAEPTALPVPPADLPAMTDASLAAARTEWARRMDATFDAVAAAQARLDDLDARRSNLAHQIDALGDLLGRAGANGAVPLTTDMAAIVAYGRGWHFGGDSSKMAAALNESFTKSRGAAQKRMRAGGMNAALGLGSGPVPAGTPSLAQWALANNVRDGRLAVLQAVAGLERWRGFYDALAAEAQRRSAALRAQAETASAARRDLAAEVSRRAIGGAGL
jgi:hypothetical protein